MLIVLRKEKKNVNEIEQTTMVMSGFVSVLV